MTNFEFNRITREICGKICNESYNKESIQPEIDGWTYIGVGKTRKTKKAYNRLNFAGVAYKKGNQIIIGFRGTDGPLDIFSDFTFIFRTEPKITTKCALHYYNQIKSMYKDSEILLTGHSLGGAYAQLLAKELIDQQIDITAIALNAPGLGYTKEDSENDLYKGKIYNCVITNDFVGTFKAHLGDAYYLKPFPQNTIKMPQKDEYDTPHGCIIKQPEEILGEIHTKPQNLGTKECWALWVYDIKNKDKLRHILKVKTEEEDLKKAIEILEQSEIKPSECFDFEVEGKKYKYE